MVGRVLHVGTGEPRVMVATVDTCSGPRAYVGVVSAENVRRRPGAADGFTENRR
jgi:hypothetical protein